MTFDSIGLTQVNSLPIYPSQRGKINDKSESLTSIEKTKPSPALGMNLCPCRM